MRRLWLVRHAMPAHGPNVPAAEWELSEQGQRAAESASVAARFEAGVRHWRAQAGRRPLVIASHGMAMTLWLTAHVNLPDPGGFWADLRFPDLIDVDPGTPGGFRARRDPGLAM